MLWQMVTGEMPHSNLSQSEIIHALADPQTALNTILAGHVGIRLPRLASSPVEKLRQLVLRCLDVNPAYRPSMAEVQQELEAM